MQVQKHRAFDADKVRRHAHTVARGVAVVGADGKGHIPAVGAAAEQVVQKDVALAGDELVVDAEPLVVAHSPVKQTAAQHQLELDGIVPLGRPPQREGLVRIVAGRLGRIIPETGQVALLVALEIGYHTQQLLLGVRQVVVADHQQRARAVLEGIVAVAGRPDTVGDADVEVVAHDKLVGDVGLVIAGGLPADEVAHALDLRVRQTRHTAQAFDAVGADQHFKFYVGIYGFHFSLSFCVQKSR